MWMCLSRACTLTSSGAPSTKDRRHADKLSFPRSQPQLPTLFLRPEHAPKQRSNPGWFAPWSANKAVTWKLQNTSTKSQNTRSMTLTAQRQMHARTHPTLPARHSHYGNERRTRRKMTVVVRPRGYTHMAKIDHFEGLFRQLWTRVSLPTNWFGKLETSWIHFCKKIAATYKLLNSPTFRPIFQIGPRTSRTMTKSRSHRWHSCHGYLEKRSRVNPNFFFFCQYIFYKDGQIMIANRS